MFGKKQNSTTAKLSYDSKPILSRVRRTPLNPALSGNVTPYEFIAPNVWMGFNNSCSVVIGHGTEDGGRSTSYLTLDPRDANWVSIEIGLDIDALKQTGLASVVLEAASASAARIDAVLRMPQLGAGFIDTPPQRFVLGPRLQEMSVQFFLNADMRARLGANKGCPKATVIFFLPVRPLSLSLASLTVSPAPESANSKR